MSNSYITKGQELGHPIACMCPVSLTPGMWHWYLYKYLSSYSHSESESVLYNSLVLIIPPDWDETSSPVHSSDPVYNPGQNTHPHAHMTRHSRSICHQYIMRYLVGHWWFWGSWTANGAGTSGTLAHLAALLESTLIGSQCCLLIGWCPFWTPFGWSIDSLLANKWLIFGS